ncbi:vgr related protein [Sphingobium nicotianae]|uniref:Vgr related protein n=1 Tax=Sphingobium nicotianae TaxID=2782607 RepID=A0A9X1DF29_9SPHN|nr:vgr related protein [Sphingobium nicotianae]MBT2188876.1 vgr related protein [Sphingobium nicotianae]
MAQVHPVERPLTDPERALVREMFGRAIDVAPVRVRRRAWWPFQPRRTVMAPRGHIHFHPQGDSYCDCFGSDTLAGQGLFLHEMTHVWQHQSGLNLLLRRHPFCRYDYVYEPGKPFARYGIEQQAEIVRHVFLLRRGHGVPGKPGLKALEAILPFGGPPA